jgi:hypothetical protein
MSTSPSGTPPLAPSTPTRADVDALLARLSPVERFVLFGVLVAQIHDIHAIAYTLNDEQIAAAESLCQTFGGKPGALAEVAFLSAAVTAEEIDHPLLTDAQTDAGVALLAALENEFGPVFTP